ncbi:MAG: alpha/beta fold hydrolase [Candidatus Methanofastidiosia archaeon]
MIKDLLFHNDTTVVTTDQWEKKREDIKQRLYRTIGFPPEPRNTRDLTVIDEEHVKHYKRQRISYTVMQDRITAYLLIPDPLEEPAPAVVAMHQTVKSGKNEVVTLDGCRNFAYGHDLAERGYVVLAPDYLTAGERVSPGENPFDSAEFYKHYPEWSIVGKNMEDSMAAVDILYTVRGVDTERIGVIGHSLGGHNAVFAMAADSRIRAGVSNCGMSVFSEEELRMEWSLEEGYIYVPALRKYFLEGLEPPFDLHEVAALIAPRPFLNISSYYDQAYGNQEFLADVGVQLYRIYRLYGKESHFSWFMHGNGHSFPWYARALAYNWLDRFLKRK